MNISKSNADSIDQSIMLEAFWKKKMQYAKLYAKPIIKNKTQEQLTLLHVNRFISTFNANAMQNASSLLLRKWEILSAWTNLSILCQLMPNSPFSELTSSEINSFLLGEGLCTGIVVHYFHQFFQTHSFKESSPFPLAFDKIIKLKNRAKFYLFKPTAESLEKQTERLRFLQASYKLAYKLKNSGSLEFLSKDILKNLEIVQRLPESQDTAKSAFNIGELISQVKQIADQDKDKDEKGYLLGLSVSPNHALAVYLQQPFHFVDPAWGIGTANNLEDLLLFLASYLTEKYPNCVSFALLAFAPRELVNAKAKEEKDAIDIDSEVDMY